MQQRRGTASEWTAANTILAAGEIGFESDTSKFKIGNGGTRWNDLPYFLNRNDIEVGLLDTDEVSEGTTNLYFTDQRAIDAVGENLELDALSDVDTTGVADGDALVYDTATTSWVPGSVAIDSLNDINDVNITTPANGEVLVYSDGDWVNEEASGGGISDVNIFEDIQNGAIWVTQTSSFGNTNIRSIAHGNNLWVAGGNTGQLRTSTDAITWTTQNSNFGAYGDINSIAYGDNLWVAGGTSSQIRTSTNAITWVTQTSNFGAYEPINSIAYGDNLWVAGGNYGQLRTSTDAITWVTQNSNFGSYAIRSIAYGDNLWVAGVYSGQIRTSTDATTWVTQTSNFGNTAINSIVYGDNLWVAGGPYGQIRTSSDAITWTTQTSNFGDTTILSIAYGDNLWVAGGRSRQIRTSTNAITWVTQTSNFGAYEDILSVAYGDNLWVAGGYSGQIRTSTEKSLSINKILTTQDVNTLIKIKSSNQLSNTITIPANSTDPIPVNSQIIITKAGDGNISVIGEEGVILNTAPGTFLKENWSSLELVKINTDEWLVRKDLNINIDSEDSFNGDVLTYSSENNIWVPKSADLTTIEYFDHFGGALPGISWTTQNSNFEFQNINSVAYGDNLWVAGGYNGNIRTSTDAITWVTQTSNFESGQIFSIAYGDNLWVAGGQSGQLSTSTNAITWTTQTSNFGDTEIRSIAHGDNLWVAGGSYGNIRTSTNAINWVTRTSNFEDGFGGKINSIAFGNNLWVAGAYTGQLRTSTNAITWVTQTSNFGAYEKISSIAYGDNLWVAGGDSGQLRTSTDAITWVTRTSNLETSNFGNLEIRSIAYGDNLWVAGASSGQIRTSTDTITWITRTSNIGVFIQIISIAYGDNLWVAGGQEGQLSTSTLVPISEGYKYFDQSDIGKLFIDSSEYNTVFMLPQNIPATKKINFSKNNESSATISGEFLSTDNISFTTTTQAYSSSGNKLRNSWSVATAISLGNNEWLITGDLSE
jgi:hypothetical protein